VVVALAIVAVAVVVLVAAAITAVVLSGDDGEESGADPATSSSTDTTSTTSTPAEPADRYGVTVGPADAPRTVVVYEDFLCPPCGQFHRKAGARLQAMAEDGDLRLVLRPVDFLESIDVYSSNAASALFVVRDAAGDDVAARFQGLLLDEQPPESGPYPSDEDLVVLAIQAGAEESDVRAGIEGGARRALVDEATQAAQDEENITAVPSVLLDGEPFPNPGSSVDELTTALLAELE